MPGSLDVQIFVKNTVFEVKRFHFFQILEHCRTRYFFNSRSSKTFYITANGNLYPGLNLYCGTKQSLKLFMQIGAML